MRKALLFFPIETIARELDYKLLIATKLATKDNICIVGQHDFIDKISKYTKNGIYFGKNVFKTTFPCKLELYQQYKKNKHRIFWLHEEGGIYPGNEHDWKKTLKSLLGENVLAPDDKILAWGEFQESLYKQLNPGIDVINTGTPRFDLSLNQDLGKLIEKFNRVKRSDFILINTNFSISNHITGAPSFIKDFIRSKNTKEDKLNTINLFARELRTSAHFLELISFLATQLSSEHFVIRPHPTESITMYESLLECHENVTVTRKFSAVEWIQKSKLLIQNGCTTSIEACSLGKPVINYFPFHDENNINITTSVGETLDNAEEIISFINEPKYQSNSIDNALKSLINNFKAPSTQIICDLLKREAKKQEKFSFNISALQVRMKLTVANYYLKDFIKFFPRKFLFPSKWRDYIMAKSAFPGFDHKEICKKVDFINKNENDLEINFFGKEGFIIRVKQ